MGKSIVATIGGAQEEDSPVSALLDSHTFIGVGKTDFEGAERMVYNN